MICRCVYRVCEPYAYIVCVHVVHQTCASTGMHLLLLLGQACSEMIGALACRGPFQGSPSVPRTLLAVARSTAGK